MTRVRSRFVDRALVLFLAVAASLAAFAIPVASTAVAADPLRVLIVGDSVTQGSSGDWTWRYRLWRYLEATSTQPVDFVGPRDDLHDYLSNENGNHDYIDGDFDRDHAARWGMALTMADAPIDELVATYQPDVVVEMLGTNDLLFYSRTPAQVEQDIKNFVAAARSADPDVDLVLSEITQTWFGGAPELNALLADGADELDTVDSRVLLADTDNAYSRSDHTFDDSHPNARGEILIAAAVADQLAVLGVGTSPTRPLADVPLGPRLPSVLAGEATGGRVTLSWTRSPGAATTQVQQRDVTAGTGWVVASEQETGLAYVPASVPLDHELQFRVLARKGWLLASPDAASNVVAMVVPSPPSRPIVTVNVKGPRSAVVTWAGALRAESYSVELRRKGRKAWRAVATERVVPRLRLRDLRPGGIYDVRVTPHNATGTGPVSARVRFRLG